MGAGAFYRRAHDIKEDIHRADEKAPGAMWLKCGLRTT
jgi:hypothetical protein